MASIKKISSPKEESKSVPAETVKKESFILTKLSIITDNLETYQGRDTVITLLHYIALIIADLCTYFRWGRRNKISKLFINMFIQLSSCRVMLRIFDDFSAIREYYRFYKNEKLKVRLIILNKYFFFFKLKYLFLNLRKQ